MHLLQNPICSLSPEIDQLPSPVLRSENIYLQAIGLWTIENFCLNMWTNLSGGIAQWFSKNEILLFEMCCVFIEMKS